MTAASPPIAMSRRQWRGIVTQLRTRGAGTRESGAFLLARRGGRRVRAVAYYDDLDAACLTGGISFAATGYSRLWKICRDRGLTVVADVHTHPGQWVDQSDIDAANPMIAQRGHIAVIVPDYASDESLDACGVHTYQGDGHWESRFQADLREVVTLSRRLPPMDAHDLTACVAIGRRGLTRLLRRRP